MLDLKDNIIEGWDRPPHRVVGVTTSEFGRAGVALALLIFAGFIAAAEAGLLLVLEVPGRPAGRGGRVRSGAGTQDRRRPAALPEHRTVPAHTRRNFAITIVARRSSPSRWLPGRPGRPPRGDDRRLLRRSGWRPARSDASTLERVACSFADRCRRDHVLGPVSRLLIFVGNAITPGKGFREGPFSSEAELRELVDLAEASRVIESDESRMIHSVFELGDTLAREVMVPRTDMVFIERHKTLRQMMSLALRSGFSRIPVIGEDLDDVIGVAYLKDVTKRVFDKHEAESIERIETVMRPSF